jgi:hypothetical protein
MITAAPQRVRTGPHTTNATPHATRATKTRGTQECPTRAETLVGLPDCPTVVHHTEPTMPGVARIEKSTLPTTILNAYDKL